MTNEQIEEIAMASIEIINKRKALNVAERTARKARADLELSEEVHFNLVAKYSVQRSTPP